tara:strand:+ start:9360 stop:11093 length:1734 start_codon:yes stop_codon:yes gene_type:complete
MSITYEAVTANCGNDSIGKHAAKTLAGRIHDSGLDAMVINCQETDFKKTPRHLEKALKAQGLGDDYTVTCLGKMATHTKFGTQFHSNTGIASYVIHKKDVAINVSNSTPVRREKKRSGTGYNKGGLVTDFTMTPEDGRAVKLQTTSGHLDSTKPVERSLDWYNLQKATAQAKVGDFKGLDEAMPSIKLGGYDVNTRNKFNGIGEPSTKIWGEKDTPPELMSLKQASPGGNRFSRESTYKTSNKTIDQDEDPKRPGSTRGGMMDLVDVASDNMDKSNPDIIKDESVTVIGSGKDVDPKTERDHDVVISPTQRYTAPESRFDAIKNQMAVQLDAAAPDLAKQVRGLDNTPENQEQLVHVHNAYLSTDGLLIKQLELQTRGLACAKQLAEIAPEQTQDIQDAMFAKEPWLDALQESVSDKVRSVSENQARQVALLDQLEKCKTPENIKDTLRDHAIKQDPHATKAAYEAWSKNYAATKSFQKANNAGQQAGQAVLEQGGALIQQRSVAQPEKPAPSTEFQIPTAPMKDASLEASLHVVTAHNDSLSIKSDDVKNNHDPASPTGINELLDDEDPEDNMTPS